MSIRVYLGDDKMCSVEQVPGPSEMYLDGTSVPSCAWSFVKG